MKIKRFLNFIFECENKVLIAFSLFYFAGFVLGCVFVFSDNVQAVRLLLSETFLGLAFKNLLLLSVIFMFGYTPFSMPVIIFASFFDGIYISIICSSFVIDYGIKGSLIVTLLFFVYFVCNIISIFSISYSSLRLSLMVGTIFKSNYKYFSINTYTTPHLIKFISLSVFTLIYSGYYVFFAQEIAEIII